MVPFIPSIIYFSEVFRFLFIPRSPLWRPSLSFLARVHRSESRGQPVLCTVGGSCVEVQLCIFKPPFHYGASMEIWCIMGFSNNKGIPNLCAAVSNTPGNCATCAKAVERGPPCAINGPEAEVNQLGENKNFRRNTSAALWCVHVHKLLIQFRWFPIIFSSVFSWVQESLSSFLWVEMDWGLISCVELTIQCAAGRLKALDGCSFWLWKVLLRSVSDPLPGGEHWTYRINLHHTRTWLEGFLSFYVIIHSFWLPSNLTILWHKNFVLVFLFLFYGTFFSNKLGFLFFAVWPLSRPFSWSRWSEVLDEALQRTIECVLL